jgi:hypothetical protein
VAVEGDPEQRILLEGLRDELIARHSVVSRSLAI